MSFDAIALRADAADASGEEGVDEHRLVRPNNANLDRPAKKRSKNASASFHNRLFGSSIGCIRIFGQANSPVRAVLSQATMNLAWNRSRALSEAPTKSYS
jgi:hypothetical protein